MPSEGKKVLHLLLLFVAVTNAAPLAKPQLGFPSNGAVPKGFGLGDSSAFLAGGVRTALGSVPAQLGKTFAKGAEKLDSARFGGKDKEEDQDDGQMKLPFEQEDDEDEEPAAEPAAEPETGGDGTAPIPEQPQVRRAIQAEAVNPHLLRRTGHSSGAEAVASAPRKGLNPRNAQGGLGGVLGILGSLPILGELSKKKDDKPSRPPAPPPAPAASFPVPANQSSIANPTEIMPTTESTPTPVQSATGTAIPLADTLTPTLSISPAVPTATQSETEGLGAEETPAAVAKKGKRNIVPAADLPVVGSLPLGDIPLDSLPLNQFEEVIPLKEVVQLGSQRNKRGVIPEVALDQLRKSGVSALSEAPLDMLNTLKEIPVDHVPLEALPVEKNPLDSVTPDEIPIPGMKAITIKKAPPALARRGLLPPIGLKKVGLDDGVDLEDIVPPDTPLPGLTKEKEDNKKKKPEQPDNTPKGEPEKPTDDEIQGKMNKINDTIQEKMKEKEEREKQPIKEDQAKAEVDTALGLDQLKQVAQQANLDNLGVKGLLANVADAKGLTS